MKKTQHVQAVYIRKMQALPGKVHGLLQEILWVQRSADFTTTDHLSSEELERHADLDTTFYWCFVGGAYRR